MLQISFWARPEMVPEPSTTLGRTSRISASPSWGGTTPVTGGGGVLVVAGSLRDGRGSGWG